MFSLFRLSIAAIVALAIYTGFLELGKKPQVTEVDEEVESSPKKKQQRTPASVDSIARANKFKGATEIEGISLRDRSAESKPDLPFSNTVQDNEVIAGGSRSESDSAETSGKQASNQRRVPRGTKSAVGTNKSIHANEQVSDSAKQTGATTFVNQASPTNTNGGTPDSNSNTDTSSSGTPTPSNISCSANYGGGAYSHPLGVSLSCSANAEIFYCLNQGACCDPETGGTDYSTAVVVGASVGNYCLSFYGVGDGKTSSVVQVSYSFNNTFPHLQVTHPKVVYQTTQLAGQSILTSNDFSKANYFMGQVNLKSHDPGPSGLNLNCEEIVDQYAGLINPMTSIILSLYDMMGASPSLELEVPLNLNKMEYGDNHITSYVINQTYNAYLYSCSTTNVALIDFDFFQMESVHWSVGGTGVQEFSGGFQSVGLYEDGSDFFRAPASVENEADLKSGLFDVVF